MKSIGSFMIMFVLSMVHARAQGFSQFNQVPLLLNPSFAGSTGGGRLAVAANIGSKDNQLTQNNYL